MTTPSQVGPYELASEVACGTSGHIFAARNRWTEELVAIKALHYSTSGELCDLKREFRVVRELCSPRLVPIYDLFLDGEAGYLVMPLVRGLALDEWAQAFNWRANPSRMYRVLSGCLSGLLDLHRAGLVHRDIKPKNIMVKENDEVVIVDFGGAARSSSGQEIAGSTGHSFTGTLAYVPPEALFYPAASPEHDVFAFGVSAFETITGLLPPRQPWSWEVQIERMGELLRSAWNQVPAALVDLLARTLDADPARRMNAAQACTILAELSEGELPSSAIDASRPTALVGRAAEMQELGGKVLQTGSRVTVLGQSGIGKTTTVRTVLSELRQRENPRWLILSGCCHPGEHLPFGTLDEVVDELCEWLSSCEPALRAALAPADLALLSSAFPVLRQFISDESVMPTPLSLADRRSRLGGALAELLRGICSTVNLVLWVDDIHWADEDGAWLLGEVMRRLEAAPLRVVLSGRELPAILESLVTTGLELGPIGPDAARALTMARAALFNPEFEERDILPWQIAAGAGNPGLVCHLAEYLATTRIPCASLTEVVAQRFQELPPIAVEVVGAMSLLGLPTPVAVARGLSGSADYREIMHALTRIGFVRPSPALGSDGFALAHDSLREAVRARLPHSATARLHTRLVQELERLPQLPREVLAEHCEGAGQTDRARGLLLEAGQKAVGALAFEHAVRCFRRALSLTPPSQSFDVHRDLAGALSLAGHAREAASCFVDCAELAPAGDRAQLLRQAATHFFLTGDNERALELMNQLLQFARLTIPASALGLTARILLQRMCSPKHLPDVQFEEHAIEPHASIADLTYDVSSGLSQADVALGAYAQGLHLYHGLRSKSALRIARALALEAGYRSASGAPESETRALHERAQELVLEHGDGRAHALLALTGAAIAWTEGRWTECIENAKRAELIAEQECLGAWWEVGLSRALLQDSLRWSGRYRELSVLTERYLADAHARGDLFAEVSFRTRFEATLRLLDDEPARAWRACDAALDWPSRSIHLQHLAEFHSRAECLLYQGAHELALARVAEDVRRLRWAPLLLSVPPRAKMFHQRAACRLAVAGAADSGTRKRLVRAARRDIRAVRARPWGYTRLLADILEATADSLEGRCVRARLFALRAEAYRLAMPQYGAALGLAVSASAAERASSERELLELGVQNPLRWSAVLLPGLFRLPGAGKDSNVEVVRSKA